MVSGGFTDSPVGRAGLLRIASADLDNDFAGGVARFDECEGFANLVEREDFGDEGLQGSGFD
jgi:hypothetical protein